MSEIVTPGAFHWDDRSIDPDGSFAEIEILLLSPSGSAGQGPENRFQSRNHRNSPPFTGIATNIKDPAKTGNVKRSRGGEEMEIIFHGNRDLKQRLRGHRLISQFVVNCISSTLSTVFLSFWEGNNLSWKLRIEAG